MNNNAKHNEYNYIFGRKMRKNTEITSNSCHVLHIPDTYILAAQFSFMRSKCIGVVVSKQCNILQTQLRS